MVRLGPSEDREVIFLLRIVLVRPGWLDAIFLVVVVAAGSRNILSRCVTSDVTGGGGSSSSSCGMTFSG
jgi:hypothetical protein